MGNRVVSIHQPNFFPWLGYFDKIIKSDIFIFLDDVQFPKTGGTWSNRVMVLNQGVSQWLTVPIERNYTGTKNVNEIFFSSKENWRDRIVKSIRGAYRKAPFFSEVINDIEILINNPVDNLSDYNKNTILEICKLLKIDLSKIKSSSDYPTSSFATERLIELTLGMEGNVYMCGGGASGYQEDEMFLNAGVILQYQNFASKEYKQINTDTFVNGLTIIDALMNCGYDGTRNMLINSVNNEE
jgi:hypothetical protein